MAPMGRATSPELVSAVTDAGAFGFLGAAFFTSDQLKARLRATRSLLKVPDGKPVPTGVGLIGWIMDKTESSDDPRLPAVLSEMPQAIWIAFGTDLGKYVAQVRAYDATREHKTVVFVIINSVADAVAAANEWKVDAIVVQGMEAGGHGGTTPRFDLLPAVVDAVPNGAAILAAGGIATGAQIAALLTMGADGVVLGTRFLLTLECPSSDAVKEVLLNSGLDATARSLAFDEVNRTNMWPQGIDGRAVANKIYTDERRGLPLEERLQKYDEASKAGDKDYLIVWAGVGAGLVKEVKSASGVVQELHEDAVAALKKAASFTVE